MTAVQMAVVGRRYTVDGTGYSTHGRITRVAGDSEIPLDPILMPMVLASDAVVRDGELIGDPTEGPWSRWRPRAASMRSRPGSGTRGSLSCRSTPPTSSWPRFTI
jgi:hypothetical protein